MFNVDESSDKGNTLEEDPLMSNEDDDQYYPFEFLVDDPSKDIPFQDCCLMLTFGNNYSLIMGIQTLHATQCGFTVNGIPHLKFIY
jgi:hypothetical protein